MMIMVTIRFAGGVTGRSRERRRHTNGHKMRNGMVMRLCQPRLNAAAGVCQQWRTDFFMVACHAFAMASIKQKLNAGVM
ncbi:hypothetical protein niasHT_006510 [Heterodera trifolii]|uniref:Secreted protein n=1 Tax=Heterodera trifolii TaxID=157864 RepID=A0ABD2LTW4_9BILA